MSHSAERLRLLTRLTGAIGCLQSNTALEVVVLQAERAAAAEPKYGLLDLDQRDWTQEALEESIDEGFYRACELLHRRRVRG